MLQTDASSESLGAVLMQKYGQTLHPVAYASRKLLPRESIYSTIKHECLALIWATKKFHMYLHGKLFSIQSDHQLLEYIYSAKHLNSRVLRWSLALMEYDFSVQYMKGKDNHSADFLSQL